MSRLKAIQGLKFPDPYVVRFFFKSGLAGRPGTVLEAGCGNGSNLMLFREYGWNTIGIDINPRALADAEANFAAVPEPGAGFRVLQHDLTPGLPAGLPADLDAVTFPSSLYYLPRGSVVRVLADSRRLCRPGAAFYLRMRTPRDFRYGRGEPVETNGFRLADNITGEQGVLNVFYHEYELVDMLRDHLGADGGSLRVLHVEYENVQNDVIVSNSDVVVWGRLRG